MTPEEVDRWLTAIGIPVVSGALIVVGMLVSSAAMYAIVMRDLWRRR